MKSRDENNKMAQNFKIPWDACFRIIFSSIVLFSLIHFLLIPSKSFEEYFLCSSGAVGVILFWLHLASEGKI